MFIGEATRFVPSSFPGNRSTISYLGPLKPDSGSGLQSLKANVDYLFLLHGLCEYGRVTIFSRYYFLPIYR